MSTLISISSYTDAVQRLIVFEGHFENRSSLNVRAV
jgi:hypothetical protein